MLMMTAGFVPSMLMQTHVPELFSIRPVEVDPNRRVIVVKGTAPRNSSIVVRRATREIARSYGSDSGAFKVEFSPPEFDTGLTIEARVFGSAPFFPGK